MYYTVDFHAKPAKKHYIITDLLPKVKLIIIWGEQMKKAYLSVLLLLLITGMTMAQDVTITGTVIKTGGGSLKDVTISLSKKPTLTATTDSDGKFTLSNVVKAEISTPKSSVPKFTLQGRELILSSVSGKINGKITVFSGNGRQLFSVNFSDLAPSTNRLSLPTFTAGLNILHITLDNETYSCPILQVGNNLYLKEKTSTTSTNFVLAKSAADPVDTLIAKKQGYVDKKTPISSYTVSNLSISMDSTVNKDNCNATTLKEAGACGSHKMLIGTAISPSRLSSSIAKNEFNYATPENEMKWDATEGSEGRFNYSSADQIVNWAQQNGVKVKGHCLVWHSQLPQWVAQSKGRDKVLGIMKKHIEALMGHFGNKVYAWDVVNEAIATDSDVGSGNARMRPSVFYTEIGADFIEQAFKIAREYADSHNMKDMKLYYNDYSIDADNDKSRFARKMIKDLVDKKVPIDGVGFQMHIGPPNNIPTAEHVRDNMQYYADLGLEVLISEWDINLCGNKVTKQQQLQLYHDITKYCVNQPKCVAITFWGINDSESWLNGFSGALCNGGNSQSLLFNNNQKKDTYTQVLNALNGK